MSTEELKELIHQRVDALEDADLLQTISALLVNEMRQEVRPLTDWQVSRIEKSISQHAEGKTISQDELFRKYLD